MMRCCWRLVRGTPLPELPSIRGPFGQGYVLRLVVRWRARRVAVSLLTTCLRHAISQVIPIAMDGVEGSRSTSTSATLTNSLGVGGRPSLFVGWEPWAWTLVCPDTVRPSHLFPCVPRDMKVPSPGTAGSIPSTSALWSRQHRMIVVTQRRPSRFELPNWRLSGGVDGRNDMIHGSTDGERPPTCSILGVGRGKWADADAARSDSRHRHGGMHIRARCLRLILRHYIDRVRFT